MRAMVRNIALCLAAATFTGCAGSKPPSLSPDEADAAKPVVVKNTTNEKPQLHMALWDGLSNIASKANIFADHSINSAEAHAEAITDRAINGFEMTNNFKFSENGRKELHKEALANSQIQFSGELVYRRDQFIDNIAAVSGVGLVANNVASAVYGGGLAVFDDAKELVMPSSAKTEGSAILGFIGSALTNAVMFVPDVLGAVKDLGTDVASCFSGNEEESPNAEQEAQKAEPTPVKEEATETKEAATVPAESPEPRTSYRPHHGKLKTAEVTAATTPGIKTSSTRKIVQRSTKQHTL